MPVLWPAAGLFPLSLLVSILPEQHALVIYLVVPELGGVGVERRSIVGLAQQRLDGEEYRPHAVGSAPFLLQDVQTDVAKLVHVGMEAWRAEGDCGRLEGVVCITNTFTTSFQAEQCPKLYLRQTTRTWRKVPDVVMYVWLPSLTRRFQH